MYLICPPTGGSAVLVRRELRNRVGQQRVCQRGRVPLPHFPFPFSIINTILYYNYTPYSPYLEKMTRPTTHVLVLLVCTTLLSVLAPTAFSARPVRSALEVRGRRLHVDDGNDGSAEEAELSYFLDTIEGLNSHRRLHGDDVGDGDDGSAYSLYENTFLRRLHDDGGDPDPYQDAVYYLQ